MKLEATVTGSRVKQRNGSFYANETEDYTHSATTAEGNPRVIADILRALADEIDPPFVPIAGLDA